jgi:hypothetical protein
MDFATPGGTFRGAAVKNEGGMGLHGVGAWNRPKIRPPPLLRRMFLSKSLANQTGSDLYSILHRSAPEKTALHPSRLVDDHRADSSSLLFFLPLGHFPAYLEEMSLRQVSSFQQRSTAQVKNPLQPDKTGLP